MRVAFVFPGQGAHEVGMGYALSLACPAARAVFDAADIALAGDEVPVSAMCFKGPAELLTLTANTQPAILTTSLACLAALHARLPTLEPVMVAGHSLGEYSALVAAGALDLDAAVKLLRLRGTAMQEAVPPGVGAMAAVIGLEDAAVASLCAEVAAATGRVVQPANFNCPGQVVVAGHADAVERVRERVDALGGKTLPLHVSAPFHCALMEPAAARLDAALADVTRSPLRFPVVANVDGAPNRDASRVRELLVRQVAGTVRWSAGVRTMLDAGVDTFIEVGPGRVLSGLIKRVQRGVRVLSVSDPTSLEATAAALTQGGL